MAGPIAESGDVVGVGPQTVGSGGFTFPGIAQELGLLELVDARARSGQAALSLPPVYDFTALASTSLLRGLRLWESFLVNQFDVRLLDLSNYTGLNFPTWNRTSSTLAIARQSVAKALVIHNGDYKAYGGQSIQDKPSEGTVAFWVNPKLVDGDITGTPGFIWTVGNVGALDYLGVGIEPSGYPFIRLQTSVFSDEFVSFGGPPSPIVDRGWVHVAITGNQTTWKCYVNGVEQTDNVINGANSGLWIADIDSDATAFSIGDKETPTGYQTGVSDFGLWDRVLTLEEIQRLAWQPNSVYKSWRRKILVDRYRLVPSGVASAEAFGTARLNLQIRPSGIATAEAFGTTRLNQQIRANDIASAEAFGTTTVQSAGLFIQPGAIASAEAIGSAKLNQQIRLTGIVTDEAFGVTRLSQQIRASGIATAEAFGVTALIQQIRASSIATAEAFGTAQLNRQIRASGIVTAEAFGTSRLNQQIRASGVSSAEAFGTAVVSIAAANQNLFPSAIATAEAFGTTRLNQQIRASAIATAEAFGTARLGMFIVPTSIASAEAFGLAKFQHYVVPSGIPTQEAFGLYRLQQQIRPNGITSAEAFGLAQLRQLIVAAGIASAEAFGTPLVTNFVLPAAVTDFTGERLAVITITGERQVNVTLLGERKWSHLYTGERRVLIDGTGERSINVGFTGDKT